MKALVIISRDRDKASTRFRFVQYEAMLAERGVTLDYVRRDAITQQVLDSLPGYDVVVNQKCLVKKSLAKKIIARSRRIVFDMDDAIWTRPGKGFSWLTGLRVRSRLKQWLAAADVVTAANEYLAGYARQYSHKVEVIHMALDLQQWQPREQSGGETVTIGWAGSPATLKFLNAIGPLLCECLAEMPGLRLAVYSGQQPVLDCAYDYTPFSPGTEAAFVRQLDIGLLPVPADDAFTRGKSPIKSLQYLACGVPVIGQVRGATAEILDASNSIEVETAAQWKQAIKTLYDNAERRRKMGQAGRAFVEREHNMAHTLTQIVSAMAGE